VYQVTPMFRIRKLFTVIGKYVSEFKGDRHHGHGSYTYPDGSKYVGHFRNDMRYGNGTLYDSDGNIIFSGEFDSDEPVK